MCRCGVVVRKFCIDKVSIGAMQQFDKDVCEEVLFRTRSREAPAKAKSAAKEYKSSRTGASCIIHHRKGKERGCAIMSTYQINSSDTD
jgi:hypothetical protein